MRTLLLTFVLIFQNFIISLYDSSYFDLTILDFFLLISLLIFIQSFSCKNILLITLQIFYLIQFLFIKFFGTSIQSHDIKLFFTHTDETFETFIPMLSSFTVVFLFIILSTTILLKYSIYVKRSRLLLILIIVLTYLFNTNPNDYAIKFVQELFNIQYKSTPTTSTMNFIQPVQQSKHMNIVLVLGESTRYKNMQLFNYERATTPNLSLIQNQLFFKTIYSSATNTDVSLPLLFNGAIDPTKIDLSYNLFSLAKNNGFHTTYITTQSNKSMQYIKPYLGKDIDQLNIIGSRDDKDLITNFKHSLQQEHNQFIALQMIGQHSPYKYYSKEFELFDTHSIKNKYDNSILYTDYVLFHIIELIKNSTKPTLFIFVSDHGELIGENGKFGHNRFEEDIYTVPFIVYSHNIDTNKKHLQRIKTHHHLYQWLFHLLGYDNSFVPSQAPYRINGTMLTGEDGHILID